MSPPQSFLLPDLRASCPLKDATNPYTKEASAESRAWINSYDIFTDRKRAFFVQGSNELLCSHTYSYAGHHQLRTTCDFVRLFVLSFYLRESIRLGLGADFFIFRLIFYLSQMKLVTTKMEWMHAELAKYLLTPWNTLNGTTAQKLLE